MSVNRHRPHVYLFPEDDANRQLANGFLLGISTGQVYVLPEAGGWARLLARFVSDHAAEMNKWPSLSIVLLVDLDGDTNRVQHFRAAVPALLDDRVFVLGVLTEPEALRQAGLGSYETIGKAMAQDCLEGTDNIWGHELLCHNTSELDRLQQHIRPILFPHV